MNGIGQSMGELIVIDNPKCDVNGEMDGYQSMFV